MPKSIQTLVIALSAIGLGLAQTNPAGPAFEVATIKRNVSGGNAGRRTISGASFTLKNWTLRSLVMYAYSDVLGDRIDAILGGPNWMDQDRFDVVAKAPDGATPKDAAPMLRTLLAERFHLVIREDTKATPAYALALTTSGSKLTPADPAAPEPASCRPGNGPTDRKRIVCHNVSIRNLITMLAREAPGYIDMPIVDRTGLTGQFDFELQWTRSKDLDGEASEGGLSVFGALRGQLGLKLDRTKEQLPVLNVVRVEELSAEN